MFSITPYAASYYAVNMKDGQTKMWWKPCTVIGIDATGEEPQYVVETQSADGSFYISKADLTRRPPPSAS